MHIHPPWRFDSWGRAKKTDLSFSIRPELFGLRLDGQEGWGKISSGDWLSPPYKNTGDKRIG
jgi:hypothetical protein